MTVKPMTGEICWTELATPNAKAAKDFYGKTFGWQFSDQEMGDMTYTVIKFNNKDLGGIWSIPKGQEKEIPPHWMTYILVDNIEEALKKAQKNGAKVMKPTTEVGENFGKLAVIVDPTGAHIALWQSLRGK
jgi:uncharacterized protein